VLKFKNKFGSLRVNCRDWKQLKHFYVRHFILISLTKQAGVRLKECYDTAKDSFAVTAFPLALCAYPHIASMNHGGWTHIVAAYVCNMI
jgi:hypothetical protein